MKTYLLWLWLCVGALMAVASYCGGRMLNVPVAKAGIGSEIELLPGDDAYAFPIENNPKLLEIDWQCSTFQFGGKDKWTFDANDVRSLSKQEARDVALCALFLARLRPVDDVLGQAICEKFLPERFKDGLK